MQASKTVGIRSEGDTELEACASQRNLHDTLGGVAQVRLEEVSMLMRIIGKEMSDAEEQHMMAELDKDGTGLRPP